MNLLSCRTQLFTGYILLQASVLYANNFNIDSVKNDSTQFLYADMQFEITDETTFFKSNYGYLINYPIGWERDKRTTDNIVLYLRPYDNKYPATFREMLTIIREPLEDTTKSLKDYVDMQNTINENTWMKYKIDYKAVNMQPFKLNNINAYQMRCTLSQVSQEKLIVLFVENNYAYKIEYTATNISYNDFLKDVRKVINSFVFVE